MRPAAISFFFSFVEDFLESLRKFLLSRFVINLAGGVNFCSLVSSGWFLTKAKKKLANLQGGRSRWKCDRSSYFLL